MASRHNDAAPAIPSTNRDHHCKVSRARSSEHQRWLVTGLLFFISTIAFLDQQTLSVLEKTLEDILGALFLDGVLLRIVTAGLTTLVATGLYRGYLFAGGIIEADFACENLLRAYSGGQVRGNVSRRIRWRRDGFRSGLATSLGRGGAEVSTLRPRRPRAAGLDSPTRAGEMCWAVFSSGNFVGAMIAPPLVAWLALRGITGKLALSSPGRWVSCFWGSLALILYGILRNCTRGCPPRGADSYSTGPRRICTVSQERALPISGLTAAARKFSLSFSHARSSRIPFTFFFLYWLPRTMLSRPPTVFHTGKNQG